MYFFITTYFGRTGHLQVIQQIYKMLNEVNGNIVYKEELHISYKGQKFLRINVIYLILKFVMFLVWL